MDNCIFCKIIAKELPSTIEFENESVIAFRNIEPVAEVHVLIVPKAHIPTFLDVNDATTLHEMGSAVQNVIKKLHVESGYKLVFNGGKYQVVPHLHWHLLGGKLKDKKDPINNT